MASELGSDPIAECTTTDDDQDWHRPRHFAKAARAFPYPISQPGLFQQVKRLEEELGFALFVRVSKDCMELTSAGRAIYERVAPFLSELETLVAALQSKAGGVLRVEASALVLRQLLPAWIRRIRADDAFIEVRVTETQNPDLMRLVGAEVDLIVDFLPEKLSAGVTSKVVALAHAYLIVPSPSSKRVHKTLADMGTTEFIAYPIGTKHRELQEEALCRMGVEPRRITEVSTAESIVALVAAGVGYSLVPWLTPGGTKVSGVRAYLQDGADASFAIRCAWREGSLGEVAMTKVLAMAGH